MTRRRLPYWVLDVFTDRALAGNPLAVFPDADGLDDATLQAVAREMNLSESVFVTGREGDGHRVRIMTPRRSCRSRGIPRWAPAWRWPSPRAQPTPRYGCWNPSGR